MTDNKALTADLSPTDWESTGEAELLRLAATAALKVPGNFLEIGSQTGGSSVILGTAAKAAGRKMYCVDTFSESPGYRDEDWRNQFAAELVMRFVHRITDARLWDTIRILKMTSLEAFYFVANRSPITLVLIDACHLHPYVDQDFATWPPILRPGGILLAHDVEEKDVREAVAAWTQRDGSDWTPVGKVGSLAAWRKNAQPAGRSVIVARSAQTPRGGKAIDGRSKETHS